MLIKQIRTSDEVPTSTRKRYAIPPIHPRNDKLISVTVRPPPYTRHHFTFHVPAKSNSITNKCKATALHKHTAGTNCHALRRKNTCETGLGSVHLNLIELVATNMVLRERTVIYCDETICETCNQCRTSTPRHRTPNGFLRYPPPLPQSTMLITATTKLSCLSCYHSYYAQ